MKPQGAIFRARESVHDQRTLCSSADQANAAPFPWRLTRRLPSGGSLELFRAAATQDLGPGCYVLKALRFPHRQNVVERAYLQREAILGLTLNHPNLIRPLVDQLFSRYLEAKKWWAVSLFVSRILIAHDSYSFFRALC